MKQTSTWKIEILAGIIVVIAIAAGAYWYDSNNLTLLHQDELQPAMERYFYQRYLQYKKDYPRFDGIFSIELDSFYVIVYQAECSIIKARTTDIKVSSGGAQYYLLKRYFGEWVVINWAYAWDPVITDVPVPFTCDGE
jgi:hypothetical protein